MALLLCEDFTGYGTGTAGYDKFVQNPMVTAGASSKTKTIETTGRGGGYSLKGNATGSNLVTFGLNSVNRVILGCAVEISGISTGAGYAILLSILTSGGANIRLYADGSGMYLRVTPTNLSSSVAPFSFTPGIYTHLELVADNGNKATGAATGQLYINGQLAASLAGFSIDYGFTVANIGSVGTGGTYQVSDLYLCDGEGLYNNSHMGDLVVRSCTVDSDVSTGAGSVTGSGTFYGAVNESVPDDDTSYFTLGGIGNIDLGVATPPTDLGDIRGVMLQARQLRDGPGTALSRLSLVSGGVLSPGSDVAIEETYRYYNQVLEINAATSAPFTRAEIAAANFRLSRTT